MSLNQPNRPAAKIARDSDRAAPVVSATGTPESREQSPPRSYLWLWFVGAFLIQAGAWTAWFIIAGKHQVEEVPLVSFEPVKR